MDSCLAFIYLRMDGFFLSVSSNGDWVLSWKYKSIHLSMKFIFLMMVEVSLQQSLSPDGVCLSVKVIFCLIKSTSGHMPLSPMVKNMFETFMHGTKQSLYHFLKLCEKGSFKTVNIMHPDRLKLQIKTGSLLVI